MHYHLQNGLDLQATNWTHKSKTGSLSTGGLSQIVRVGCCREPCLMPVAIETKVAVSHTLL